MKTFLVTALSLCLAIAAILAYAYWPKTATRPVPVSETSSATPTAPPVATHVASAPAATHVSNTIPLRHHNAPSPSGDSVAFQQAIDTLVSPRSTFDERRAAWVRLREAGQLDQAIDTLKQGAKDNPDSPQYAAMLGQAYLQKAGEVSKSGGSMNELGILGMSADQSFDNALKIDPANWDAQFYKAISMYYWPPELNKGNEVLDRLSNLINQQNNQTTQPEYSLPYLWLGNEYQKLGQTDNAQQTWQAGATKFPNDSALQQKLSGK